MRKRRVSQGFTSRAFGVLAVVLVVLARAPIAEAITEAERSFLALYFTEEELQVVSATRSLQSIARVAENVEVVTADDIELMNAHTLADVLYAVNGVKVDFTGRFGAAALVYVQGSDLTQVTVLLDGVPLNNVSDNVTEVGFFPVTDIARVEIVKGPASSAWGSALGGVVNVITKGPAAVPFQASASLGLGRDGSADYRAAVSGRVAGLGYYLSGTGLRTDGLTDGFDVHAGFLGAKLVYAFSDGTDVTLQLAHGSGSRGDGTLPAYDLAWDRDGRQDVARLALRAAVGSAGRLDFSLWSVDALEHYFSRLLGAGEELARTEVDWKRRGAGASYARQAGGHALVAGADYSIGEIDSTDVPGGSPDVTQWAVYANDTISLGRLSLVPGIRYDDVSISEDFVSPSLGATYALSGNALVRATVARGFSLPSPIDTGAGVNEIMGYQGNPGLKPETVWSYQAGVEANVLDALWLKAALFRHDLDDAFADVDLENGFRTMVNRGRQRRQGLEVGLKTAPYRNVVLAAGATLIQAEDRDSGETIDQVPKRQYNASLTYDDRRSFRALLAGNYRREVYEPAEVYNADMSGFMLDLHLARKFALGPGSAVEVFASVHNLLDEHQYWADVYKNPGRWAEAGVRVAF